MHIIDITMFWTPTSGGVRTYLEAKRRWLRRRGLRHHLLVPGARTHCDDGLCTLPAPPLPFGHGYRFPLRRRPWVARLVELAPDIIEAGDPYLLPWAALEAGRRLDVPVVGFYHSDLPRLVANRLGRWADDALDAYVARLYRRFDRVLAPSEVMARKLQRLGVERTFVQPLGVDVDCFHPRLRDQALRQSLGLSPETRLLIFAGRGSREKNIPLLLRTMQRLGRRYHLHLVGSGMPRRLPPNVSRSSGFLAPQEVARLLASSDALLHGGGCETFGLVVLEAMASGLPVVGIRSGAVAELVVPGTGLLAPAPTDADLADTVRALFADGYREMGRIARRHVVTHYAWDKILPRLLDHYRELCGTPMAARNVANG
ncbi:MAG TPA: glycosyltransferase family 1 protein [Gammaproteobacteria bacterium]|nr:glycosyltransferase family 1 protein [Gammaproteobacteria bacterium]